MNTLSKACSCACALKCTTILSGGAVLRQGTFLLLPARVGWTELPWLLPVRPQSACFGKLMSGKEILAVPCHEED